MAGNYEMFEAVGHGGMANVYRARDLDLEREVAIKELSAQLTENERFVHLFLSEARKMASISHPNVLPIFAIDDGQERPRLVMELAASSLADQLSEGPVEPLLVKRIGRQVLAGLEAIHQAGLVHRDIKPGNILYSRGFYKIADFGIATGDGDGQTQVLATPKYMSPEILIRPHLVGPASDLYSLGLLLYEALVGSERFERAASHVVNATVDATVNATVNATVSANSEHLDSTPPAEARPQVWHSFHGAPGELLPPHLLNSEIPEDLSLWISKLVKKDLSERFETCREAITTLDRGVAGLHDLARESTPSYGAEMTQPVAPRAPKKGLSTLQIVLLSLLLVMGVVTVVTVGLLTSRHRQPPVEVVLPPPEAGIEDVTVKHAPPPPSPPPPPPPELPGTKAAASADRLAEALTPFLSTEAQAALHLESASGSRVRFGELLRLRATSSTEAYAAIFLLFSTGDAALLYPSARAPVLRLAAGRPTTLPLREHAATGYRIEVSEPAGRDHAFLLTSTSPLPSPPMGPPLGTWMSAHPFTPGDVWSPAVQLVRWAADQRRDAPESTELVRVEILVDAPP